jgi:hypothetical protein
VTDTGAQLLGGRYRLLQRLGWAWRARDELLHREVAVTEVRLPPPGPDRDRLVEGVHAAAKLRHPAIVTTHDVLSTGDGLWVVRELLLGPTLSQALRAQGPLPAVRAAAVGSRVLEALTAAAVPHGTLSAGSVILGVDGRVAVTGFGLAPGTAAGDLHDLGVLLYTAIEGHPPDSQSAPMSMGGHPLTTETAEVPAGPLGPLVSRLLDDDPSHRPDTRSVHLALRRAASGGRRPWTRPVAIAAALFLAAAAAMLIVRQATPPAPAPPSAHSSVPAPLPTHFTAAPDACRLITGEQAAELSLNPRPMPDGPDCKWRKADDSLPKNLQYRLDIQVRYFVAKLGDTPAERAQVNLDRFRKTDHERTRTSVGLPVTKVVPPHSLSGFGEAAYTVEVTNSLTYNVGVVFRVANVVVAVQYQREIPEDPGHIGRAGAIKASQWVLASLAEG